MISTVTTTTTTTTTTATAIGVSQAAAYGALAVCILIVLLIAKELLSAYVEEGEVKRSGGTAEEGAIAGSCITTKSLARNLSAAIHPLLFCFLLIVIVKVLEVL